MELHALDRERLMSYAHDLPFRGPGRDLEFVRQLAALRDQRNGSDRR